MRSGPLLFVGGVVGGGGKGQAAIVLAMRVPTTTMPMPITAYRTRSMRRLVSRWFSSMRPRRASICRWPSWRTPTMRETR